MRRDDDRRRREGRARPTSGPGSRRFQAANRPPDGEPFIWMTLAMVKSEAWAAMPLAARKVVERIAIEHMGHGGKLNGELTVTYDQFVSFGIRRSSIREAIEFAVRLGWIDITVHGSRSYGMRRVASAYGLTWLPRCDSTPPSNRWKSVTAERAKRATAGARTRDTPTQYINSSPNSATGQVSQNSASASNGIDTGGVPFP